MCPSMILRDPRTEEVFAVMVRQNPWGSTSTFALFCFEPIYPGQEPSATQKHSKGPLYQWAKITRPIGVDTRYDLFLMDHPEAAKFHAHGSKGGGLRVYSGRNTAAQIDAGKFIKSDWSMKIGPGVDPSLMICFLAVMDEINQMNLRQQQAAAVAM